MISKNTENLIVKYINKAANAEELDQLRDWVKKPNNYKIFKEFVRTHYSILYTLENQDKLDAKEVLLQRISKDKSVIKQKRIRSFMKYAAAAIFVLGLSYYYQQGYLSNIPTQTISEDTVPVIIEPGTNKAVLTLEDGSNITLGKGKNYQSENVNSNGEKLAYSSEANTKKSIVYNYLTIPRGGQFYLKLSDDTEVWLNSATQLKYPVNFITGETREVELVYGEAYFVVSPSSNHNGSRFNLICNEQEVEVIGTQFNVKAYKEERNIYTTLVEGKIDLNANDTKRRLTPNEQLNLNLDTKELTVKKVDVYNEISWKEGVFSFEGKPLKDIVTILSRWYDVEFVFENKTAQEKRFNGSLRKDVNINEVLNIVKNFGIIKKYEIKNKIVLLK